jgi:hypothetical protein
VTERLALTEAEQVLRGKIEVGDDEVFVERDDGDAEATEDSVGVWPARKPSRPGL